MEVLFPRDLEELWTMISSFPGGAVMAGGTDLLVRLRKTGRKFPALFCLEKIEDLRQITENDMKNENKRELFIGAAVVHQRLLDNETVRTRLKGLWEAVAVLGSPPVRHSGTLGGNLCTASPAGDTLPPLHVLGARVEIRSRLQKRSVPIGEFITGPGRTSLKDREIVAGVSIPLPPGNSFSSYYKVGKRKAMAIAVASLAVYVARVKNGAPEGVKLAWGSVGPTVIALPEVEALLQSHTLSEEIFRRAGKIVSGSVSPIDDIRGSAEYRRKVAGNLLMRLLHYL